ncbi:MAG: TonB-dependent receptor family protein [Gammaproteobacteria bacterium]
MKQQRQKPFRRAPLVSAVAMAVLAFPHPAAAEPSGAQAKARSDTTLGRVLVTAGPEQAAETAGSVQVIDAEALDKSGYADVNRVLRQVPGVNIVEEEGYGIRPNIGIRGSGTDRNSKITVMEDGVLIAPAPYAGPAAYYFPRLPRMSAVEVAKGPAAIKYGPRTVAGAINLSSTPIPEPDDGNLGGKLDLFAGEFGTTRAHGVVGGYAPTGKGFDVGFMLETLQEKSDGFKKLDSGGTTGYDIEDYVAKLALRSAADAPLRQALEFKFQNSEEVSDETYLGLTLADFNADPYRRYRGSQVDQMNVDHETYQLTHRIDFGNRVDLTTIAYATETRRNWYKLNDVLDGSLRSISAVLNDPAGYATAYQTLVGAEGFVSADNALRVRANNRAYEARGIQTVLGVGFDAGATTHQIEASVRFHQDEEDRFQHQDLYRMDNGRMVLTTAGAPGSQDNRIGEADAWAVFVRDTIDWDRWTLVPGLRYETIDLKQTRYGSADPSRSAPTSVASHTVDVWMPGLGALYHLDDHWKLLAGLHRGFSSPAPGSNADPEKSWNYEAGVRFSAPTTRFEAIGFFNDYSNLVGTCTASTGGACAIGDQFDGGEARVYGLEVLAGYDAGRRLGWGISVPLTAVYTYTQAEFRTSFNSNFGEWGDVTSGEELPYVPEHQLTLSAGLESDNWRTQLSMNYVDQARTQAGSGAIPATQRVDSRTLFDVSGEYDVTSNASVFASVQNLTDQEYNVGFRPAGARPGMPRSFMAGLKLDF